jgi:hypothetical protein
VIVGEREDVDHPYLDLPAGRREAVRVCRYGDSPGNVGELPYTRSGGDSS